MKNRKRKALPEAERRKKIAIFVSLCVAIILITTLLVLLLVVFKSDNDDEEKKVKIIRVFTNLDHVGPIGPEHVNQYKGTALEKEVEVLDGIQLWTVPFSGMWYLEVYGASGAHGLYAGHNKRLDGGFGAKVTGKLKLREGDTLKILVGHQGLRDHLTQFRAGSGGGGSFVVSPNDKPIMVAGGGGGGGVPQLGHYTEGGPGMGDYGGNKGKGGKLFDPKKNITVTLFRHNHDCMAGAGGGFHGDGAGYLKGWGGKAFVHGGGGGMIVKRKYSVRHGSSDNGYNKGGANGGFGGGGASGLLPGGGGGFFGGNVRGAYLFDEEEKVAKGGSSYNVARHPTITPAVHRKHGRVFAKYLGPEELPFGANHTTDPRIPKTREDWYKD